MKKSCCFHFNEWKENKNSPLVINKIGIALSFLPENILLEYCIFCGFKFSEQTNKKATCSDQDICNEFDELLKNNPESFYFSDSQNCYFFKWKGLNNILYYCLFCGGQLPVSATKPVSEEDLAHAKTILAEKKSVKEIIDLLGQPTGERSDTPYLSAGKLVVKDIWFTNFIKGCVLHIQEFDDEKINYFLYSDH